MAAQAVDFTVSGQVSRTLFVVDSDNGPGTEDDSTKGTIRDNNGATRVRANGSSVLEDGSTLGIQFEYAMDAGTTLRHANIQYTGEFGRITFGQGSEAGDGSAGLGPGVTGIGAGQDGGTMKPYFSSLDGGGRTNMVRYDTPAIGPLSAAFSVGNDDSVSGLLALNSDFGGTVFGAKVGTHMFPGDKDTTSASVGLTMPSGLAVGGAWGRGNDHEGMPAMPTTAVWVADGTGEADAETAILSAINAVDTNTARTNETMLEDLTDEEQAAAVSWAKNNLCDDTVMDAETIGGAISDCAQVLYQGTPATMVDPSYFRMGIGYTFGNTTVAASWYNSEDFVVKGSDGTAFGVGASHALPKVGATIHVSLQNYEVERPGMAKMDETVFQLGTLVKF